MEDLLDLVGLVDDLNNDFSYKSIHLSEYCLNDDEY